MKVLIFGPSGAGKTYVSSELRKLGINAIDADTIEGLSSWFDKNGNKVTYRKDADEEFFGTHSFLWDRKFLESYLRKNDTMYVFGASGNVFDILDLFDRVYFLKVAPDLQKDRLMHESRENPMGSTEYQRNNAVSWGQELEKEAIKRKITLIDATLTPKEIFDIIKA